MKWEEVKNLGSAHYKSGLVEPLDLYKSGNMLQDWVIGEIMQHAYRNRTQLCKKISIQDMEKIKHFAEILISFAEENI